MKIAVGNSRMDRKWKNKDITWEAFVDLVKQTIRTTETVEEYKKMNRAKQDSIKDVGGFVGGELKQGKRRNGHVLSRSLLTLDMDYAIPGIWDQIELLYAFKCCVYSTHKHTPNKPRLRLIIPLKRDVSEDEYPAIARMVAKEIGIDYFDDTTYEPSRLMYWPSTPSNGEFFFNKKDGDFLDPDVYLSKYVDWRDTTTWPVSSRQSEVVQRNIKKQADPLEKDGIIGAFCRAYSIEEAIDTFLNHVYEPSLMEGRYDYIPADSSAGVVIYNGKFAYSHHATDPASGYLLNAFDLVRLHLFQDLDDKASYTTATTKLPSFKAMTEFALKDELVKAQFAEERKSQAEAEFSEDDWEGQLELDKTGAVKNTLKNLILILEHDPNLQGIVFNELSDNLEIVSTVPWSHPSKYWRDADDAQLISYIDAHYGSFSARNYDVAIAKVADDRSYHPIRDFIDDLPEWDKVPRVDTLLIDYLGADDNPYVRAVTRKTLCAAISRVLTPGIKFDSMLVLNGPQGVGKSTLIARLGGEWFSDSLSLSDTKDKTAAEKLQGYWIIEIGELAGLKKAEVETLRSFLSRQNDIYRASFGRRVTPHLRQCVFFGTTNAEKGYLRDTTGNRRFWPVKTPGDGIKKSWEVSEEEVLQIWAETLEYVKQGEKLYLEANLEQLAKEEQREAMESDEREGLVREYLDMLLPEDWDEMDLYERRAYINGTEFGDSKKKGVWKREYVSNMEIWCECFGKDRSNLRRMDGNEIATIMASIGGWTGLVRKERISIYGPQWVYVPKD
ncbi:virulence-associated E family protein [Gracilibacillus alcaliphilus]|uniref:virulence-associated E family protein n=1 Tax=Gracilibacillus alcaliphilus TaxID=1401441 RepID=UPI00195CB454|nr:virulence-associated E family protein [Gracilibacillus alcaliphilus]MBM7676116.1 putative P-loop ATPase [Gracilibacillus alcaliphilus]